MENTDIFQKLQLIEDLITEQTLLQKPVLNFQETCKYLEVSASHLYKMTSKKEIPHFCPNQKKLYFKREELDQWLLRNRQLTHNEIESKAANYLITKSLKN